MAETLQAALQPLTSLTQLVLAAVPVIPASLTALTRLERCAFEPGSGSGIGSGKLPRPNDWQLPGGPWLAHVSEMLVEPELLDASRHVLNGATALRLLAIPGVFKVPVTEQARILRWAAGHPNLRRMELGPPTHATIASFRAVVDAEQRNPALNFAFGSSATRELWRLWPEPEPFGPWEPKWWTSSLPLSLLLAQQSSHVLA